MSTEGGGLQRQFFDMLMESQWWSAERLRDYQRTQLSQLLRHAKKNVPFYEHRLDAVLKPNGDVDWDRWSEIPTVKRQDLIEHREPMQATVLPAGHGPTAVFATSGSTGLPISVTTNGLFTLATNGLRWRSQVWSEMDWSSLLAIRDGNDAAVGKLPDAVPTGIWGPPWEAASRSGYAWTYNKNNQSPEVFDYLARTQCKYVVTGPKTAHAYALDARRMGVELSLDAFACQGTRVDDDDREICQSVFGARLIEHYSSKEGGHMANACPLGILHVNEECGIVEVLRQDGSRCAEGETGRVVITPFVSTAQPMIRYEQGDLATVGGPCKCGRVHSTLSAIVGRQVALFRHPDGRTIAQLMPLAARNVLDAEYMQVAQIGPNDYDVRYVPKDWSVSPDEPEFVRQFREAYFSDANVRLTRTTEIPSSKGGKFLDYVNEYPLS